MSERQAGDEDMVLVPRLPTKEMIEAAWECALNENADGVWREMISAWLRQSGGKSEGGSL